MDPLFAQSVDAKTFARETLHTKLKADERITYVYYPSESTIKAILKREWNDGVCLFVSLHIFLPHYVCLACLFLGPCGYVNLFRNLWRRKVIGVRRRHWAMSNMGLYIIDKEVEHDLITYAWGLFKLKPDFYQKEKKVIFIEWDHVKTVTRDTKDIFKLYKDKGSHVKSKDSGSLPLQYNFNFMENFYLFVSENDDVWHHIFVDDGEEAKRVVEEMKSRLVQSAAVSQPSDEFALSFSV